ncbi:RNA chaperone Hfq [Noviherbaspirillum soli]|uniref:RNA chaperone Hfq n=1 Tax=Noviherbaspirillum soli TaxID=1064518 RepID=UPI00188A2BCF|nr:RNA chaperone Hfq [Noviherbaspirillum soli]
MERPLHALQNKFLQDLQEDETPVAIYLVNGIRLQGQVDFFDNYIVAVKSTTTQLVYKHAISTIAPIDGEAGQPNQEKRNAAKPNVVVRTKPSRRAA